MFTNSLGSSLFILVLFFIYGVELHAQEERKFRFALIASPSLNWLKTNTEGIESNGTSARFSYGLQADFALGGNPHYYFTSGLFMLSNGGKLKIPSTINDQGTIVKSMNEVNLTARYIEIPLGVKMRSGEIGYSHIAGTFALGTGIKINELQDRKTSYVAANGSSVTESKSKEESANQFAAMRLGLIIGLEWQRNISGETYAVVGVSFNNGFTNVLKGDAYVVDANGETDLAKNYADGSPKGNKIKATSKTLSLNLGIYF